MGSTDVQGFVRNGLVALSARVDSNLHYKFSNVLQILSARGRSTHSGTRDNLDEGWYEVVGFLNTPVRSI